MIRLFEKKDIPKIIEGFKCWLEEKEGLLYPEYMDINIEVQLKNYNKELLKYLSKRGKTLEKKESIGLNDYYVYDDIELKGFVYIDSYYNPGIIPVTGVEVGGLYVFHQYRGEGIGTKLFDHVVNLAKKSGATKILLTAENETTRKYYMDMYNAKIVEYGLFIPLK